MKVPRPFAASLAASLLLAACGDDPAPRADAVAPDGAAAVEGAAPLRDAFDTEPVAGANYGDGVAADAEVLAFADLLGAVRERDSVTAVVRGEVVRVCRNKGCWMTLAPSADLADGSAELTVRFKDYGFFMPKDLAGNAVVAEGTARRRVVPVEELRHYAEDAGESPEAIAAITEPEEELEFVATGVRVL